jgi:osmotically-inducible protein OsmY
MMSQQQGMNGQNKPVQQIRPRQKVAFESPVPQMANVSVDLQTRMTKNPKFQGITFSSGSTGELVLRGQVGSEAESRLAASVAMLEPGVRKVKNELTFPKPAAAAE